MKFKITENKDIHDGTESDFSLNPNLITERIKEFYKFLNETKENYEFGASDAWDESDSLMAKGAAMVTDEIAAKFLEMFEVDDKL